MKLLGDARRFRDDLGTLLKVCDSPFSPLSTAMIVYTWVTSTQNFFEARILHSSAPQCAIVISLVSVYRKECDLRKVNLSSLVSYPSCEAAKQI